MSLKKLLITLGLLGFISMPTSMLAASENANQTGQANQGNSTTNSVDTTQNQTNNPNVGTMTQEQARTELQTMLQQSESTYTPTRTQNQTRLNLVSTAVQNMLTIASRIATQNTSISNKIQTVAKAQIQMQDKVNQALDKAESRSGFAKFFVGPNYKQLKTVKQEMEQNQLRIQELNQIMSQISNQGDKTELQNQIKVLEDENTALSEQLNQDVKGFSLFGWLSRLISKY